MIIDFHTHIFPDALAPRAMASLIASSGDRFTTVTDGTKASIVKRMDEWGIDVSVIQPIITKSSQLVGVNEWAQSVADNRIVAFGGIFPYTDNYKKDIDFVAGLGLKGLKFHVEYQHFVLDTPEMLRIYDYALSKGLMILHHAGFDPAFPTSMNSSPEQFANVLRQLSHITDEMRGGTIIAAHLGGQSQWDDVLKYLAGKNIYLDTSNGFEFYGEKTFMDIVRAHGADKILFASDSPWTNAKKEMDIIKSLPLTEDEKAKILGLNAKKLLKL